LMELRTRERYIKVFDRTVLDAIEKGTGAD